jgi:hypothetical protein
MGLQNERMFGIIRSMTQRGDELGSRIGQLSAQVHAATSELVQLAVELDTDGSWAEVGVRSCAHWLSINTGVDVYSASEMLRVGHALACLPRIAAAFSRGQLSFDKVRAITRVATPEDEDMWLGVALHASGAQLTRICRAVRHSLEADDPQRADDALARRSLHAWWRDDGMLELMALLPREDGGIVMAALEAAAKDIATEQRGATHVGETPLDPARPTRSTLRADALVRLCEEWVADVSRSLVLAPTRQLVVHVDSATLTEPSRVGRRHIEDGPWLPATSVDWLSCDADVVAIIERNGLPIDVGRAKRIIPPRLRLALQSRDLYCRFPGCSVPACRAEGHHIEPWKSGGRTDLANLVSLCRFHHHRYHEGKFVIRVLDDGELRFETCDGQPLVPEPRYSVEQPLQLAPEMAADTPRARDGGAPLDFPYVVSVIADGAAFRRDPSANRGP